jgi:carbon monoxide dehydrogenase subunit G
MLEAVAKFQKVMRMIRCLTGLDRMTMITNLQYRMLQAVAELQKEKRMIRCLTGLDRMTITTSLLQHELASMTMITITGKRRTQERRAT